MIVGAPRANPRQENAVWCSRQNSVPPIQPTRLEARLQAKLARPRALRMLNSPSRSQAAPMRRNGPRDMNAIGDIMRRSDSGQDSPALAIPTQRPTCSSFSSAES